MAGARYLLGKYLDPPFALLIGFSAAWVRIRREEVDRYKASFTTDYRLANPGSDPTPSQLVEDAPTHADTYALLVRRLKQQEWNPTKWNWRGMTEQKERKRWGIVEPSEQQRMIEEMNRK